MVVFPVWAVVPRIATTQHTVMSEGLLCIQAQLFTKRREPTRMELNSLNTQHATLPTDTAHQPYRMFGDDCRGDPLECKHLTMHAAILKVLGQPWFGGKNNFTSAFKVRELFILFRLKVTSTRFSDRRRWRYRVSVQEEGWTNVSNISSEEVNELPCNSLQSFIASVRLFLPQS